MDVTDLDNFIDEASALTKSRSAEATHDFGLGHHARYHLDLEARTLSFFDAGEAPAVAARVVPVGSLAHASQSWQWSWENDSIPEAASKPMLAVKQFGEMHDVGALQEGFAPCDEVLAWAQAAISLKILDAQCVYRIEQPKNFLFVLLFDLTHLPTPDRK